MQRNSIPPYKPPPEIQAAIKRTQQQLQQNALGQKRRRTVELPKRNWIQRNPRLFQVSFITVSLLIFFSRPLYDIFILPPQPMPEIKIPPHKR